MSLNNALINYWDNLSEANEVIAVSFNEYNS